MSAIFRTFEEGAAFGNQNGWSLRKCITFGDVIFRSLR